jgi:hypothetical protein
VPLLDDWIPRRIAIADLPDSVSAAAMYIAAASSGDFTYNQTHQPLTQEQLGNALQRVSTAAQAFQPPGQTLPAATQNTLAHSSRYTRMSCARRDRRGIRSGPFGKLARKSAYVTSHTLRPVPFVGLLRRIVTETGGMPTSGGISSGRRWYWRSK